MVSAVLALPTASLKLPVVTSRLRVPVPPSGVIVYVYVSASIAVNVPAVHLVSSFDGLCISVFVITISLESKSDTASLN